MKIASMAIMYIISTFLFCTLPVSYDAYLHLCPFPNIYVFHQLLVLSSKRAKLTIAHVPKINIC